MHFFSSVIRVHSSIRGEVNCSPSEKFQIVSNRTRWPCVHFFSSVIRVHSSIRGEVNCSPSEKFQIVSNRTRRSCVLTFSSAVRVHSYFVHTLSYTLSFMVLNYSLASSNRSFVSVSYALVRNASRPGGVPSFLCY